jgi:hypothetical protein
MLTSAQDPSFPASEILRQLVESGSGSGKQATLLRVALLRRDHPDARLDVEIACHDAGATIVKASIAVPNGASASGFATGPMARLDAIEHDAISHALDLLGHTMLLPTSIVSTSPPAATGHDLDLDRESDDARDVVPVLDNASLEPDIIPEEPRDAAVSANADDDVRPATDRSMEGSLAQERQVLPRPEAPRIGQPAPRAPGTRPAVVDAVRRSNLRRHTPSSAPDRAEDGRRAPASAPAAPVATNTPTTIHPDPDGQPPLEDYSWTAFWRVARQQGLDKVKVEALIGRPIEGMNPGDVRAALAAAGVAI